MKKATLDPTDENILQTIKDNGTGGRNREIKEFVETLDMIEDNMFLSLDAEWGVGKTFYVKQLEKTLEYHTLKKFATDNNENQCKYNKLHEYFKKTNLEDVDIKKSYFPVYYNAWLYDNHGDPLLSLISVIVKKYGKVDTKLHEGFKSKVKELISSVSVSHKGVSVNGAGAVNAMSNKDILEEIQLAEDVQDKVKEIFDYIISGNVDKLVIFIDELDRCRPSYALELLERIKHYFDDDRIIFIVSLNKEQLTHTITNYYGTGFDATGYLNKFFDLEIYLPVVQNVDGIITDYKASQYWLNTIANALIKYYKLTLRDALIYKQRIEMLSDDPMIEDNSRDFSCKGLCMSTFIPIIIILDMKSSEEKNKFVRGESNILENLKVIPEVSQLYERFGKDGYEKLKALYEYIFVDENEETLKKVDLSYRNIGNNVKYECLRRIGLRK